MKKKTRFLAVIIAALTVLSFGACSDIEMKIKQMRCEHEMNDGDVTVKATCEDAGERLLTCTLCGYEETEDIPAMGHIWQNVEAVSPACTEDGNTSGINCKVCGEWFMESVKIPATGHSVVIDEGYSPTCTEKGFTDGSHCGVCNEILTSQEELPANGHNVVTVAGKAPTCTEKGFTDGSHCGVCNEILTAQEEIPANGHNVVTVAGKAPTCKETGLTDGEVCETCGVTFVEQEEIPMIACADVDRNYYCDNCNTVCLLKEGTYSEVGIDDGDSLLNRWIRIYRADDFFSNKLSTSCGVDFIAINDDTFPKYNTYIFKGGPFYGLKSFCVNVTNEYIDFYFAEGTYELYNVENGEGTGEFVTIDETTTIIMGSSVVYCLVPIEA